MRICALMLAVLVLAAVQVRADQQIGTLFDPARHMHVSEVRAGMKGYGLSVFKGSKIEKFDVEVIDVVKNFNPKYDAVLVRCEGAFLEHTGPIEGMSGSPIYLYDDTGKARMIGAFAYGWPLSKDPIGGVQPIEYMLNLPANDTTRPSETASTAGHGHWSLDQVPLAAWNHHAKTIKQNSTGAMTLLGGRSAQLQPLATPLMAGGFNARTLAEIAPLFAGTGLVPMQAGSGSASVDDSAPPKLEPGSVLAVPLMVGDFDMTAVGTCTDVVGDRIFGFGHMFLDEGAIALPVGSGTVATVVANLEASFKLGFVSQPMGTLTTDQTVGVSGRIGKLPPMIPLAIHVIYDDGSLDQTYHFSVAVHPKLTPSIAGSAVVLSITGDRQLPEYHTVKYDLNLDFANGENIHLNNTSVAGDGTELVNDLLLSLGTAADNEFLPVHLSKLSGTIHVQNDSHEADILSVMVPRSKYKPGEKVKVYISYQPFHGQEGIFPAELDLPHDLPDGTYQLTVSDWMHYLDDERTADPFKFTAQNIGELFSVIRDVTSIQHNAVYLRLVQQQTGVAVGRTAMPRLPSSQRQVLIDSGRSDVTPFVTSTVKVVPTDIVMNGQEAFQITVEKHSKVDTTAPAAPAGH